MYADAFDWDDDGFARGNTRHVAANHITTGEFEEAFRSIRRHEIEDSNTDPDNKTAIGFTREGRELRIVFVLDEGDDYVLVRPVTAYDPGGGP